MDKEETYRLYVHINKINNKKYIGITRRSLKERCGNNGYCYHKETQRKFYNAIQKYGWDNFEHIVLFENMSKEMAELSEIYMIKKFDTMNNGYNTNLGKI